MQAVEWSEPFLPHDKPRYAMGPGTPPQLLGADRPGRVDMFDRPPYSPGASSATAFTAEGTLNLKNAEFALQQSPIGEAVRVPHVVSLLAATLAPFDQGRGDTRPCLVTLHHLHFYLDLMRRAGRGSTQVISTRLARLCLGISTKPRNNCYRAVCERRSQVPRRRFSPDRRSPFSGRDIFRRRSCWRASGLWIE